MFKSSKHIGVISYASRHGRKRREKRNKQGKIHCVALSHKNSRSLLQIHLVSERQSLKRGSFNDLLLSPTFLRGHHRNTVALSTKFPTRDPWQDHACQSRQWVWRRMWQNVKTPKMSLCEAFIWRLSHEEGFKMTHVMKSFYESTWNTVPTKHKDTREGKRGKRKQKRDPRGGQHGHMAGSRWLWDGEGTMSEGLPAASGSQEMNYALELWKWTKLPWAIESSPVGLARTEWLSHV